MKSSSPSGERLNITYAHYRQGRSTDFVKKQKLPEQQRSDEPQHLRDANTRLQEELDALRSEVNRLMDGIDVPLITVSPEALIHRVNAAARRLLGQSEADLRGRALSSLLLEKDHQDFHKAFQRSQQEQTYAQIQSRLTGQAKASHHIRVEIDPILGSGRAHGARVLLRDVEQEHQYVRQLQASQNRYQNLVETVHDIIYRANPAGFFTYVNPTAEIITGYPVNQLIGMHYMDIVREDYVDEVREFYLRQMELQKENTYLEMPIVRADGQEIWVGQKVHLVIEQGEIKEATAVSRDITDRKMAEEELRRAKELAEASRKTERKFLRQMRHETQTPMNAIIGMAHLLYDTPISPQQREYIDSIRYSAELLSGMLSNVLDLSRMESGHVELAEEVFELPGVIKGVCRMIHYKLGKRPVQMACDIDPRLPNRVMGSKVALIQILANLLSNAEKFTHEGGIRIGATLKEKAGPNMRVQFRVEDTGIGIPKADQEIIFENFQQGVDVHADYGGSGLGLSIVRKLVEIQNGEIWLESTPGKGSTFYFELPLISSSSPSPSSKTSQSPPSDTSSTWLEKQILIVEDNRFNQTYLSDLLTRWAIPHDLAEDGLEALEHCEQKKYDLILMDIQMPQLDGHETTMRLRSLKENLNCEVPIVALSAGTLPEEQKMAFESGMNDFLNKPFTPDQLHQKLTRWLGSEEKITLTNSSPTNYQPDPRLDAQLLAELYAGDIAYMCEMFNIFADEMPAHLIELRRLQQSGDLEKLASLAHKVKPTFAMVGYPRPGETLETITEFARSTGPLAAPSLNLLLDALESDAATVLEIVKQELNRLKETIDLQGNA